MSVNNVNGIITELYDMVQDAKSALLSSDKCMIERERFLDLLDEMIAQLPEEIKSAQTIIAARDELIMQAKKEAESTIGSAKKDAENMLTKAKADADAMITKAKTDSETMIAKAKAETDRLAKQETIYTEAQKQCKEMLDQTNAQIDELKKVSNQFMDDALRQTEDAIARSLQDVKTTRAKFNVLTGNQVKVPEKGTGRMFVDMDID